MKTIFFLIATILFMNTALNAQLRLSVDTEKTILKWLGEKIVGQHTGTIAIKDGWLSWDNNKILSGEFLIDMTSIKDDDANARLEGHLKSDDFFGVDKFSESKLVITGSEPFDKGTALVRGNLTIKSITNPVEFRATVQKKDEGTWFFANIVVDRSKYNVRYGSGSFFANLGDKTIYDEFKVKVNLLVK